MTTSQAMYEKAAVCTVVFFRSLNSYLCSNGQTLVVFFLSLKRLLRNNFGLFSMAITCVLDLSLKFHILFSISFSSLSRIHVPQRTFLLQLAFSDVLIWWLRPPARSSGSLTLVLGEILKWGGVRSAPSMTNSAGTLGVPLQSLCLLVLFVMLWTYYFYCSKKLIGFLSYKALIGFGSTVRMYSCRSSV
uniref:Uncharacterized protein n=1 Tax=Nelumbo nucifera TaxID=4432 RepID=A0A822YBI9_NELNU|nr:TPA_asm: hypothetical protein HUJ06_031150 [Nelumbo nucifera]